jgi:ABC-type branched-subunit amino acid transport system substrate-binding protein
MDKNQKGGEMSRKDQEQPCSRQGVASRRAALQMAAALAGGIALPGALVRSALAADFPPIGSYPASVAGAAVFVGICTPRTGTYAAQGEDEIKGYQLAIEHLNTGNALIRKISPHTKKGVLNKQVTYGIADSEAKPNSAVQAQSRFISENKAVMSAVAVAINKLADREKVIYLPCISGSNDTTGKDCVRYSFRQCFYAQTAAQAIAPVLVKNIGKGKKIAFLTPDYTYGHTVRQ